MNGSVRPSVRLYVRHTFVIMFPSSYHHEAIINDRRDVTVKSQGQSQGHRVQNSIQPFPDRNSSLNSHVMIKLCTELDVA